MLPQFPKSQRRSDEAWQKRMFETMHRVFPLDVHPPVQPIIEGKRTDFQREDRQIRELRIQKHQAVTRFDTGSGKGATIEKMFQIADELGESMGKQKWKMITAAIDEAVAETGNELKIKKGNITQADIIRMAEMTVANFDETGTTTQKLICTPELAQELSLREAEWRHDKVFQAKLEEIKRRKKAEFDEREARRRLAD